MGLEPQPVVSRADELLGDLDARVPSNRGLRFATGFDPLDDALGGGIGLHELTVLGGAAGAGKTIAALQWARSIAMTGRPVVYLSFQHSPAQLLRRLLVLEIGSLARPDEAVTARRLQTVAQEVVIGAAPLRALLTEPLGEEAYGRIRSYGAALQLVAGSAATTGLTEIAELIDAHAGRGSVLVVDPFDRIRSGDSGEANVAEIARALKDLALHRDVAVVAVASAAFSGLTASRLKLQHLWGATAIAQCADLVVMVNRLRRPSRSTGRHASAVRRPPTVFSIAKHLDGPTDLHLEFAAEPEHFRFDPNGSFLTAALVDPFLADAQPAPPILPG